MNIKSISIPSDGYSNYDDKQVQSVFLKKYLKMELERLIERRSRMIQTERTIIKGKTEGGTKYQKNRMCELEHEFDSLETSLAILKMIHQNEYLIDYFRRVLEEIEKKSEEYQLKIKRSKTLS